MIKIISVGKIKEKYLIDGIEEYAKRLSKYTKLERIELKDMPIPNSASTLEEEKIKVEEGKEYYDQYFALANDIDMSGIDFSPIGIFGKDHYFFDSYHLNAEGADVFTSELTEDLRSIMNRRQNEPKDKR